jgi:hypothetical protein
MKSFRTRRTTRGLVGAVTFTAITVIMSATGAASGSLLSQRDWQDQIVKVDAPSTGCFKGDYPKLELRAIPCTSAPSHPMLPRRGPRPMAVGAGNDLSAKAPSGAISMATGSFEKVDVMSEKGPIGDPMKPSIDNAYSLQLNTNPFVDPAACVGSPNPNCQGWEQFVYENDGSSGKLLIQYWLIGYGVACPASWFANGGDCYRNSASVSVPNQPITNLGNLQLTGHATIVGDYVTLLVGNQMYLVSGLNAVYAAQGWTVAEFNVFGDGGGTTATFNAGASLTVRTQIVYGGEAAPICVAQGFTAEKNSLSFGTPKPPPQQPPQPGPAIRFIEDTVGGKTADCAYADSVGDVHALTTSGLAYDFQAAGDFEMAQVGPDFEVQARHVSGAPTWPDAVVNRAVGTRMGNTRVTVCYGPSLVVDGRPVQLADGGTISLASGVDINLVGGVYVVTDQSGNSVQVQQFPGYLNMSVGVGTWPTTVRGLLGNPNNDVNFLEASDGTVFSVPLSFGDLYQHYGNSWRVQPSDSLLAPCGRVEESNPTKPFHVDDLDPRLRDHAQTVCTQAGVPAIWLDDCELDVAVLGDEAAAEYVGMAPPVLVSN